VDAHDRRGRAVAGGDLFEDQREAQIVEPRPVPLGRHGHPVAAERREAAQLVLREVAIAIPLRGVRRDAVLHVGAHRILHGTVVILCGSLYSAIAAIVTAAKASLTSHRPMSFAAQPVFFSTLSIAPTGAVVNQFGACACTAWAWMRAIGLQPSLAAVDARIS